MDRMRPMIARALREMDLRLRAEKIIPAVERMNPKAKEKRTSGTTLEKTPRLMIKLTIPRMSAAGARRLGCSWSGRVMAFRSATGPVGGTYGGCCMGKGIPGCCQGSLPYNRG